MVGYGYVYVHVNVYQGWRRGWGEEKMRCVLAGKAGFGSGFGACEMEVVVIVIAIVIVVVIVEAGNVRVDAGVSAGESAKTGVHEHDCEYDYTRP